MVVTHPSVMSCNWFIVAVSQKTMMRFFRLRTLVSFAASPATIHSFLILLRVDASPRAATGDRLVNPETYKLLSKYDLIGVGVMLSPNSEGQVCASVCVCRDACAYTVERAACFRSPYSPSRRLVSRVLEYMAWGVRSSNPQLP